MADVLVSGAELERLRAIEQAARDVIKHRTSFGWCKTCGGSNPRHTMACPVGQLERALGEGKNDG